MYVAKRLVLLVSNMKNQCKMLRDGFIQAQLVSRSVYPGKDSPLKQYVKHPLINLPRFCLTPFPGKRIIQFSVANRGGFVCLFCLFFLKLPLLFWP